MEKKTTLRRRFVTFATVILTCTLGLCSVVVFMKYRSLFGKSLQREQQLIYGALENKGTLLGNILCKISPEAIMALDMYSLKLFSTEILNDEEVMMVEIFGKDGAPLISQKKPEMDHKAKIFERVVRTDKAKLGVEMEVGKVRIALSTAQVQKAKQESESRSAKEFSVLILGLIVFTVLVNVILAKALDTVLQKTVILPLRSITGQIQGIQGDLRKRIAVGENNEVGMLASHFNGFLENMQAMVKNISKSAESVSNTSDVVATSVSALASASENIASKSNVVSNTTASVTKTMSHISSNADGMASSVQTLASAIEEMSASLSEVARRCQEQTRIVADANAQASQTREMMDRLNVMSKEISKIIEVINNIADQTNLLALNATIEAATAGDAGKGFAVVASAVKDLARQTAQATSEIGKQIEDMQNVMGASFDSIEKISGVIGRINQISQTIVTSVDQQSATINEIAQNVNGANTNTAEIAKMVQKTATDLNHVAENIQGVTREITNQVSVGIATIGEHSTALKNNAGQLEHLVDKFKV